MSEAVLKEIKQIKEKLQLDDHPVYSATGIFAQDRLRAPREIGFLHSFPSQMLGNGFESFNKYDSKYPKKKTNVTVVTDENGEMTVIVKEID